MMLQKLNQYRQQFSFPMVKVGKAQKKTAKLRNMRLNGLKI